VFNREIKAMEAKSWEHLIKPYKVEFDKKDDKEYLEVITVEPLEKGFGLTLGNALRRVLLSSIQGTAVTSVKFSGALLEFSAIPGVVEDVTDIILNIKSLDLHLRTHEAGQKFSLSAQGPCVVVAGMIEGDGVLDILNPDQPICTLGEGAHFNLELYVSRGKGYVPAALAAPKKQVGEIIVDARFNPVKKVSYVVEHTRVAQSTDYDRLILTIETNGSITPREALTDAACILQNQLQSFASFSIQEASKQVDRPESHFQNMRLPQVLFSLVKDLDLPVRCLNCLKNAQIVYLGDLVKKKESDLLKTPNFGRKSLNDINEVLGRFGLSLGMDFPEWPPENIENYLKEMQNREMEDS